MNTHQPPLKPVMDLLEHVRENRVLQISGQPSFSVQSALNILSGLDTDHTLSARPTKRTEKIKQLLGWSPDPQYSVLQQVDEAALNWAHNEGYFDQPLHVHAAPPLPGVEPVQIAAKDRSLVVHSSTNGQLGVLPESDAGCERLLLLYIQAAHEQLLRMPIVLNQSGLSLESENNINTWGLSLPSSGMDVGSFVVRKNFAEAYAALILLAGTNGSEHAHTAVGSLMTRNATLQRVWDGERDVWQHHMGPQTLQKVLDDWSNLSTLPASDARMWVERNSGLEFGSWLNDQPLAEIVVGDIIPSFDKRVLDVAHQGERLVSTVDPSSPLHVLKDVQIYLHSKWEPAPLNSQGVLQILHRTIQRTGVAMGWMVNHDATLQHLAHTFETQRSRVCEQIVAELHGTMVPNATLSSRLEQYRKGTSTEPYVLPPIP